MRNAGVNRFVRALLGLCWAASCAVALAAGDGRTVDWSHPGGGVDEGMYSGLKQVDRANVGRLGLAWFMDLPGQSSLEATPLAVDGVLYFTGSRAEVYAVEAASGKLLWQYDPETWKHAPGKLAYTLPVNRGVAYAKGRVFVAAIDGRLIALDAATGAVEWAVETIAPDALNISTGAPRVFEDKVIIGNAGADFGARGYVTAYFQDSGRQAWRFYTVPGSPQENRGHPALERAAKTWSGEYWKTGSGGTVWNGITYDPKYRLVYIGVGNGGPYDSSRRSPGDGDNLYLASIVALDAATGAYVWHYQMNPRESWDYKCTANMVLATLEIGGAPRDVIMQAPTNGFYYVLDRRTGKLLSAEKIGKVTWAERIDLQTGRPVEAPGIRYTKHDVVMYPGTQGAHNWQAMAYSPDTGLAYIPYMQMGTLFSRTETRTKGFSIFGMSISNVVEGPEDGKGALLAWDPVAQKARWKVQHQTLWNGGAMATAGGLVFQGTADGYFSAYDAESGERLWHYYVGLGVIAAPSTWAVDGKQYVSLLVGYGGAASVNGAVMDAGWSFRGQPRRILTFALGGAAKLPPGPPADRAVHALDDPKIEIDEADVIPGRMLYSMRCASCHGLDLQSAGAPAPDLRESPIALHEDALWTVLNQSTLLPRGMPVFTDLSREQVRQIYAYIRAGARESLGLRPPLGQAPAPAGPR